MKEFLHDELIEKSKGVFSSSTYCVPARILGSFGYIIEATTGNERPALMEFLNKLIDIVEDDGVTKKYWVYGLRHFDNDWTYPVSIGRPIVVNRFGWFVTSDCINEIEEGKEIDIVRHEGQDIITDYNLATFYNFYKDLSQVSATKDYIECSNIDLYTIISEEDKIIQMANDCIIEE